LDGGSGGAYATTLGDLFTGEMPVLGPIVGSIVAPVPGGGTTGVNIIEDFDPFTVMYQVVEDGRIIVTNRDLTRGLERSEEIWPTEIWVDAETQESWEVYSGRLLVTFDSTVTTSQLEMLFVEHDLEVDFSWFEPLPNDAGNEMAWFHLTFEGELQSKLDELTALPNVLNANPYFTEIIELHYSPPNDPYYASGACRELNVLRVVPSHLVPLPPPYSNQIVAVLDTGVLASHEDLEDKVTNVDVFVWGNEYLVINNHQLPPSHWSDHGTAVAGVIGALTNNAMGVASCAPAVKVLPVRIAEVTPGEFHPPAIPTAIRALREVFPHGGGQTPGFWHQYVRVANMSFGNDANSLGSWTVWATYLQIARDNFLNDRLYVASAGNDANDQIIYPAALPNALGVSGAVVSYDMQEWYLINSQLEGSNYRNDGYATYPISGIFSLRYSPRLESTGYEFEDNIFKQNYRWFNLTSSCAAQISSLAALLYTERPTATRWEVQQHIITCHRIYDYQNPEYNPHYPIAPVADFYTALKYW